MEYLFKNKVVVITGALGALGKSLCCGFSEQGATVIATFRGNVERFERSFAPAKKNGQTEMKGSLQSIIPMEVDVTNEEQVQRCIAGIVEKYGAIDVLINNAGTNQTGPFMMQESEDWHRVLDTNITGTRHLCTAVSRPMMVRRRGSIINISSVLGDVLGRGAAAYGASKAALNRFTEILAVELGKKGIRVNAISPGLLETGMGENMLAEAESAAVQRIPMGRKGTVDEVTAVALFLASDAAGYITGHTLTVDGGLSHG